MGASKTYMLSLENDCILWFGPMDRKDSHNGKYQTRLFFWEADSFRPDIKKVFCGGVDNKKVSVAFKQEHISDVGDVLVPYTVKYDKRVYVNVR